MLFLSMDGRDIGPLNGGEFAALRRQVVDEPLGFEPKRPVRYSDISLHPATLICGAFATTKMLEWVRAVLDRKGLRRNLALVSYDELRRTGYESTMIDCLLTKVILPAVDKSAKTDAAMTLKVLPERLESKPLKPGVRPALSKPLKPWSTSTFEFMIDGLDAASRAVQSVGALSIVQGTKNFAVGASRRPTFEPTKITESNLVLTMPSSFKDSFVSWLDGPSSAKSATLRYLSGKDAIITLQFKAMEPLNVKIAGPSMQVELFYGSLSSGY